MAYNPPVQFDDAMEYNPSDADQAARRDFGFDNISVDRRPQEDFLRSQLDTQDILDDLEHQFRGDIWDIQEKKWVNRYKPMLADEGISVLMTSLRNHLNKNLILSYFDEDEIRRIAFESRVVISETLTLNFVSWNLTVDRLSIISQMIDHSVIAVLKRAYKGKTLDSFSTITKRLETVNQTGGNSNPNQAPQQKGGWMSLFKG